MPNTNADLRRSAFVSYAGEDVKQVRKWLPFPASGARHLIIAGNTRFVRIDSSNISWFYAPLSLEQGAVISRALEVAILQVKEFHLFWSETSSQKEWVNREVDWALARWKQLGEPDGFFKIYKLDRTPLDKRLDNKWVWIDASSHAEHPEIYLTPIIVLFLMFLLGVFVAQVFSPILGHIYFYIIVFLAGAIGAGLLFKRGETARAMACVNIALLSGLDAAAWTRLSMAGNKSHPALLQAIDWAAYGVLCVCAVLAYCSAFRMQRLPKIWQGWLQTSAPAALALAVFAFLTVLYWWLMARYPTELRSTMLAIWRPRDGVDTGLITLCLYLAVGAVSALVAIFRVGWPRVALLTALPPAIYVLVGPWTSGGMMWEGTTDSIRWAMCMLWLVVNAGAAWYVSSETRRNWLPV